MFLCTSEAAAAAAPHLVPVAAGEIGLADAKRLRASSSSCCFFARACLSLHVSFLGAPPAPALGSGAGGCAAACACCILSKGFWSFLGGGSDTGVYAVPCGNWSQ